MHKVKIDEFEIEHLKARLEEKREEGFGEVERRVRMCPKMVVLRRSMS